MRKRRLPPVDKPIKPSEIDVVSASTSGPLCPCVVIDTNVILDLFLYKDPRVEVLREALKLGELCWLATPVMREELARVLKYEHIQKRLLGWGREIDAVPPEERHAEALGLRLLAQMDAQVRFVEVAPRARYVCKDGDDQKFIDLAQAHQSLLISKDKAVLTMKNRMARVGVQIMSVYAKADASHLGAPKALSLNDDAAPTL